jgi:hypothetical protein
MPFPIEVTRCLAFAEPHKTLRVCSIPFERIRTKLAARGLHERDEIVVELITGGTVLVAMRDGRRLVVERHYALMIEVDSGRPVTASPRKTLGRIEDVAELREPVVCHGANDVEGADDPDEPSVVHDENAMN